MEAKRWFYEGVIRSNCLDSGWDKGLTVLEGRKFSPISGATRMICAAERGRWSSLNTEVGHMMVTDNGDWERRWCEWTLTYWKTRYGWMNAFKEAFDDKFISVRATRDRASDMRPWILIVNLWLMWRWSAFTLKAVMLRNWIAGGGGGPDPCVAAGVNIWNLLGSAANIDFLAYFSLGNELTSFLSDPFTLMDQNLLRVSVWRIVKGEPYCRSNPNLEDEASCRCLCLYYTVCFTFVNKPIIDPMSHT